MHAEASLDSRHRQQGAALLLAALVLLAAAAAWFAMALAAQGMSARRDEVSERALAEAREALVAYAASRPINASVGPGYLPCPDLDNDGWAEPTCGSLNGDSGQAQRLGRLPWKTLGLRDLRDGHGERLWYAVSTKYKGLLNCGVSAACVDMTPGVAFGTITVRDSSGTPIHDGTRAQAAGGGAAAVIVAPGAPLLRLATREGDSGSLQGRECAPGECDSFGRCLTDPPQRAATCDPRNYLDRAPGGSLANEDNADFVDRSDAAGRPRNGNGFIHGPVASADGRIAVNDRLAVVAYRDLMPRIMKRVALEISACLRFYGTRPENGGRYPRPTPACGHGDLFGTVPDTPFDGAAEALAGPMLQRWWRTGTRAPENLAELPARDDACRIAVAPMDPGPLRASPPASPGDEGTTTGRDDPSWWNAWKPRVFYAVGAGFQPSAAPGSACTSASCVELANPSSPAASSPKQFVVVVAAGCPAPSPCSGALGCNRMSFDPLAGALQAVAAFP